MLYYIKKYPVSLAVILTVIYLSFFKPPTTELGTIPNLDKVVHICMYFGMSGMLWLEFLRAHRKDHTPIWHAWVGPAERAGRRSGRTGAYRGREWRGCLQNQNCRIVFRRTAFPEMPLPATGSDAYFRTGFRKR